MVRLLSVALMTGGVQAAMAAAQRLPADEPLLDWSAWRQYRGTVAHPASVTKPGDLERARENQRRHEWARRYAADVERGARAHLATLSDEWLARMVPTDTPGDGLFTPCPACRDQGKPAHPHGQWTWRAEDPDLLTCQICGTAFPNEHYPEDLVFRTRQGQTISFYGGPPFTLFGYQGRPSFTANIRARKVSHATGACRQLAEAYALTGTIEYAQAVRRLLLRLADVYPGWLVHVGYGEYADMDPHLAALNINALPVDEITSAPAGPDRRLHSGYWQGGRATGTGMEAGFVRSIVEAYTFVAAAKEGDTPVLSEEERLRIEQDLILESTVLLVADKSVNNKSVGNATAVALVGMVLGHPEMVRFGLRVFLETVDGWFLADGSTSESYAYATMTLSGIEALGQAFRGYCDPPGYTDAKGERIDRLDLYHDTAYKRVWEAMFNGLQGDLRYPPLADSYQTSALGATFVELMAANYADNLRYVALLKELAGRDLSGGDVRRAIYLRSPLLAALETPPLALPDHLFPVLRQGYLRSGPAGRDSLLVLDASHWGGHHHLDSLNLYYWQDGQELLSDLGYLWDHPKSNMTRRTFAHNTVMVDGAEQATRDRGGEFTLFAPTSPIKLMEAESRAYAQASLYRRTVAQIEHAPGRQYVLDVFRVQGGTMHDYVFHGPGNEVELRTPQLEPMTLVVTPVRFCVRLALSDAGAEIELDDVSIVGPDGKELVQDPSLTQIDAASGLPLGLGVYQGDGSKEFGQRSPGRGEGPAAFLRAVERGREALNVALIIGSADGYTGPASYQAIPGQTYRVSFWLRGRGGAVATNVLYWPTDPNKPEDRQYTELRGIGRFAPTPDWTRYTGEFTLENRQQLDLHEPKVSQVVAPWRITWKLTDQRRFTALWQNDAGFTSLIGAGWGQRDFRNTDVGATLPYLVRRTAARSLPTVFASVFEGHAEGEALVTGVRLLPVPETAAGQAVAVAVDTEAGTDYAVSCLQAEPLRIETADGPLEVNGRFALVSLRQGQVAASALVEGSALRFRGQPLTGH
jgi:hypothetical protein